MKKFLKKYAIFLAFTQALCATVGSLYFSEIRHFTPCILCWYQRIFMYPMVVILGIGILHKDTKVHRYILPLSAIGWLIALYHNLLYYHVIPESISPCQIGVSCTTKFFAWFGFITIPLLSLLAFTVVGVCMVVYDRYNA